jgi:hypothetical protein
MNYKGLSFFLSDWTGFITPPLPYINSQNTRTVLCSCGPALFYLLEVSS